MSLYSIGEVARICGINPVTLRAWQRRYGLLKPQRSEGGHRLFDDNDIDTIRTILSWINRGVPVGQVRALLEGSVAPLPSGWSHSEQRLLTALQESSMHKVRQLLAELGREYPAMALINNVIRPLRNRLGSGGPSLNLLRHQTAGRRVHHQLIHFCAMCAISGLAHCQLYRADNLAVQPGHQQPTFAAGECRNKLLPKRQSLWLCERRDKANARPLLYRQIQGFGQLVEVRFT